MIRIPAVARESLLLQIMQTDAGAHMSI